MVETAWLTLLWFVWSPSIAGTQPASMTTYQMVFLHANPAAPAPGAAEATQMQAGHLAHLLALNAARTNLLFGPFLDGGDLRGIAVLDVADAAAARQAFAADPYVKAGLMTVDVRPWMTLKDQFQRPVEPHVTEPLIFGFLKRGTNATIAPAEAQALQKGHIAYMEQLHAQGKLVVAGPFAVDGDLRGVVIYRVKTVEEAKALAAEDPAVKAGRLTIEARPWMTFKGIIK